MFLTEAAKVERGDGDWMLGYEAEYRDCSLQASVVDNLCEDPIDESHLIQTSSGRTDPYRVGVFGIATVFKRSLWCAKSDDEDWLRGATKAVEEQAAGRAMTMQMSGGANNWIGDPGCGYQAVTGTKEDVVDKALALWHTANIGDPPPLLHSSYELVRKLVEANIILRDNGAGKLTTIWGNEVVVSPGYPEDTLFWSGPITIKFSTIQVDTLIAARQNDSVVRGDSYGAVDFAPCSIVRIGAAPVQTMIGQPMSMPTKVAPNTMTSVIEPAAYTVSEPPPFNPQPEGAVATLEAPVDTEPKKTRGKSASKANPKVAPHVDEG